MSLYVDEARIPLVPLMRAMWPWVGEQLRVPMPGKNVTRSRFGALNIRRGRWVHLVRERMFKEDLLAFLDYCWRCIPAVRLS